MSHIELEAKVKLLKSNIKTLKRELTLAQKASFVDKVQILSLEAKVRELEANEDLSSKEYTTIEYMEKGIESSDSIYKQELDIQSSERLKLMEKNRSLRDQLVLKKEPRGTSHNEVDTLPPPMNNLLQPSTL
ncbi:hypothetical protein C1645_820653 [Glomus cerebriforme]|uniref:Uncharacterized protein n=1 Tax=Glomus cerebriforme TaxID=658196 RepID=A0A397TC16_9GLOM|nr:hypothetical protein C1645_820653 [Glomus cerebriforme]